MLFLARILQVKACSWQTTTPIIPLAFSGPHWSPGSSTRKSPPSPLSPLSLGRRRLDWRGWHQPPQAHAERRGRAGGKPWERRRASVEGKSATTPQRRRAAEGRWGALGIGRGKGSRAHRPASGAVSSSLGGALAAAELGRGASRCRGERAKSEAPVR
ncbi:unnamed protein product [Caretta caretta]